MRVNSEAIVDGGDMQYSRNLRQLCLNNSFIHIGKYRHRCPHLNMNPASASDWRAKRFGLDIDRPIIAITHKSLENLLLRDQLSVGLRM